VHPDPLERYEILTKRSHRWWKISTIMFATLLAVSLGNLAFYLWRLYR
jgi:hypothetical protein